MVKNIVATFAFIFVVSLSFSQRTMFYSEPNLTYRNALELFNKQKYGQAEEYFIKTLAITGHNSTAMSTNSEFYAALCAVELYHENAEFLLLSFIEHHPESPKIKLAYFHLGRFHYRKKRFEKVIEWMERTDKEMLTENEVIEYNYKLGYSYFATSNNAKAKGYLFEVKDKETPFKQTATYYYSHIAYQEKNYETALQGFQTLKDDENFGPVVPYYIVQIYYLQSKYEKVIEYAPALLDSTNVKRSNEITRILGESHYGLGQYKESIPYLEKFIQANGLATREDYYQLGFAYYKTGDNHTAITNFSKCIVEKDSLTQNALYLLGTCYINTKNKNYAKNAFQEASKMNFDKEIKEDALFNFAKVMYDISFNPYNEAIDAFQLYLKEYPNSPKRFEAYSYLMNLYLTTNNYKDALESIEKIDIKDEQLKTAYQQILYNRGVELFNGNQIEKSLPLLEKSSSFLYNKTIQSLSYYWLAEAYYRKNDYNKSISNYKSFLFTPGAVNLDEFSLANYNVGYCLFNQKNYNEAATWFRKYLKDPESPKSTKVLDASLRVGDCYFINKDYSNAYDYYSKATKESFYDADYAMYQQSLAAGLTQKFDEKENILSLLIGKYPNSTYIADAKFELGKTYQIREKNDKALAIFDDIINNNKSSILVKSALSKKGMILYNNKEYAKSLETFKSILRDYPNTEESKSALVSIRNISVDINQLDTFFTAAEGVTDVSTNEKDSMTYQGAINRYLDNDCENAVKSFDNYLSKFNKGLFALNANFYKSECEYKQNNFDKALIGYEYVIDQIKNKFTETALIKACKITYEKADYEKAYKYYSLLDKYAEDKTNVIISRIGQMRTSYKLKNYPQAIEASKKVLSTQKINKDYEDEAQITIARSAYNMDSLSMAIGEFQYIAKSSKTEIGAESKYFISMIYFRQGLNAECEKQIFELINQVPSYDYWVAKAFILLSDNYVKLGNNFQAKHTLKSIIDNYDGKDLVLEAQKKLDAILLEEKRVKEEEERKKAEMEQQKILQQQQESIKYSENKKEQETLFIEASADSLNNASNLKTDSIAAPSSDSNATPTEQTQPKIEQNTAPQTEPVNQNQPNIDEQKNSTEPKSNEGGNNEN